MVVLVLCVKLSFGSGSAHGGATVRGSGSGSADGGADGVAGGSAGDSAHGSATGSDSGNPKVISGCANAFCAS